MTVLRHFRTGEESFFLFGPRGTGKSTLVKKLFPSALCLDLLDPKTERTLKAKPELLYGYVDGNPGKNDIVIDEIQNVPSLLSVVHDLIEKNKKLRFILTGSSARKLKRSGANLLGGRALSHQLFPFMLSELRNFDFKEVLQHGLIPLIYDKADKQLHLQAYISLYLKEEIQMEGLTRNADGFSRFLEAISFSHASILNVSNIARECEVKRKTVESYVNILEDLLLVYKIPVFAKKAKRELMKSNKIYLFDSGLFTALRPRGILEENGEIEGLALEGLVMQHLQAWNKYWGKSSISFWRTKSGLEVDFVIYGENNFVAIEVKNSRNLSSKDFKGLLAFKSDYPEVTAILLYRGSEKIMQFGILCIPVEDFLRGMNGEKIV